MSPPAREGVCPRCGDKFFGAAQQRFCKKKECHKYKFSVFDRQVISEYKELCKKYRISAQYTFRTFFLKPRLDRIDWKEFLYFRKHSEAYRDRRVRMLQKFIKDFKAGYYELDPLRPHGGRDKIRAHWGLRYVAKKKMSPGRPECPMKLQHCEGGLYPGDCKRRWRECALFARD